MAAEESALHLKYRPKTLGELIGQQAAVSVLKSKLEARQLDRAIIMAGPPGTGKTTAARILRRALGCGKNDYCEVNCASVEEPMKTVRRIQQHMTLAPTSGKCRVWCLDEFQALSRSSFSQQALLKTLEDTPKHVYFILCTTDPGKIIKAIQSRCLMVRFVAIKADVIKELLIRVAEQESIKASPELLDRIVELAEGGAREALKVLNSVRHLKTEEERLAVVCSDTIKDAAFRMVKSLVWGQGRTAWTEVVKLLEVIEEPPETVRHLMLACAAKEVLKGGKGAAKAQQILCAFEAPFYESGRPGLVRACYEVFSQ